MEVCLLTSRNSLTRDREMDCFMAALRREGHRPHVAAWEDNAAWEQFDVIVIRSVWNYWSRLGEFLTWMQSVKETSTAGTPPVFVNDERLVRWNCHKRYLTELGGRGIPIVATRLVVSLAECLAAASGHEVVVIKPAVGCGAVGCSRVLTGDLREFADAYEAARAVWPEVVVQPYHASITDRGEISAVTINGTAVQTLCKMPRSGDWRVQREYGGTVLDATLQESGREIVDRCASYITDRCGAKPLYMRVDFITSADGPQLVSEVELIEPVLYSDINPAVADALVSALPACLHAAHGTS